MKTTFHALMLNSEAQLKYLRDHIQCRICEDTRGMIAFRKGKIGGMYVFDNWTDSSVQVHQAITDPVVLKHGFHREAFKFLFGDTQRTKLIGLTPSDNEKALKLNHHLGFVEEARIKDAYDIGIDYIIMTITPDQCRYYDTGEDYGKRAA
jgi:RimJ/RimL family protein N-acetyltransferase